MIRLVPVLILSCLVGSLTDSIFVAVEGMARPAQHIHPYLASFIGFNLCFNTFFMVHDPSPMSSVSFYLSLFLTGGYLGLRMNQIATAFQSNADTDCSFLKTL